MTSKLQLRKFDENRSFVTKIIFELITVDVNIIGRHFSLSFDANCVVDYLHIVPINTSDLYLSALRQI